MELTAHKTTGPKGVGVVRRKPRIAPGSADARWRPRARHAFGHLPTHQIVGMGMALPLPSEMGIENRRIQAMLPAFVEG